MTLRSLLSGATLTLLALLGSQAPASPVGMVFASYAPATYQTPAFVQGTSGVTLGVAYAAAQNLHDLNVVAIGWENSTSTIASVTDTEGNTYAVAAPLNSSSGNASQVLYYAANIAAAGAGANTVTIAFTGGGTPAGLDVRIAEWSGIATSSPLDANSSANASTGTALDSGGAATTQSVELLVGAAYVANAVSGVGTGWTQRVYSGGDNIIEDQNVTSTATYHAIATQTPSGFWITQIATFKAATGVPAAGMTQIAYLVSLESSGNVLNGQHANHFGSGSGTYGGYLSQFTPSSGATPSNITITDLSSGNTGLAPAILGVFLAVNGSCGSGNTTAQGIATIEGQLAAGGLVEAFATTASPAYTGGCTYPQWYAGIGTEFNGTNGVLVNGSAIQNAYLYGTIGNSTNGGQGAGGSCTSSNAATCNGGLYGVAQALKTIQTAYPTKKIIWRQLPEAQVGGVWYQSHGTGTGPGGATPANYIALWNLTRNFMIAQGVTNLLYDYVMNYFSGGYSQNDPGNEDIVGLDYYSTNSIASDMGAGGAGPSGGNGFGYANSLGKPFILGEVGQGTGCTSATTGSLSNAGYTSAMQGYTNGSNMVGFLVWNQQCAYQVQNGAATSMTGSLSRSALPIITN